MTSSGWPKVVTSAKFKPAPKRILEKLIGFFSIVADMVLKVVIDIVEINFSFVVVRARDCREGMIWREEYHEKGEMWGNIMKKSDWGN